MHQVLPVIFVFHRFAIRTQEARYPHKHFIFDAIRIIPEKEVELHIRIVEADNVEDGLEIRVVCSGQRVTKELYGDRFCFPILTNESLPYAIGRGERTERSPSSLYVFVN